MTERPTAELWALLDAPQASTADNALEALAERGAATKWRSAELQPRYAVSTTQLETTTRCRGDIADAVGVLGEQSVEKGLLDVLHSHRRTERREARSSCSPAMLSSVAANQSLTFLPEIWRFVVVQLLCFAPYGYLSLGLVFPEDLQRYVVKLYTFLFPAYRARLRRHEAGHLVAGHALGLPVANVSANAAYAAVEFRDGRSDVAQTLRLPKEAVERQKPRYGASPEMIAVVSLAGIMAEIDEYADAEGGAADLAQLQSIFDGARMSEGDVLATTRWAALQAHLLLKRESGALEAVVAHLAAVDAKGETPTVSGCVRALEEGCPNVYESRRKNRVEPTLLERLLVRPPRRDLDDPVEYDRIGGLRRAVDRGRRADARARRDGVLPLVRADGRDLSNCGLLCSGFRRCGASSMASGSRDICYVAATSGRDPCGGDTARRRFIGGGRVPRLS